MNWCPVCNCRIRPTCGSHIKFWVEEANNNLARTFADQRLREENTGVTDSWRDYDEEIET